MKKFLVLFFVMAVLFFSIGAQAEFSLEEAASIIDHTPDRFLTCQKDSDCLAFMAGCGDWRAINKANSEEFHQANNKMIATMKCAPVADPPEPSVGCIHKLCSVK